MKKSSKKRESSRTMAEGVAAVGLDLSDRTGRFYAIDEEGLKIAEGSVVFARAGAATMGEFDAEDGDCDRGRHALAVDQPTAEGVRT